MCNIFGSFTTCSLTFEFPCLNFIISIENRFSFFFFFKNSFSYKLVMTLQGVISPSKVFLIVAFKKVWQSL